MNDLFSPAAFIDHQISLLEQEKAYIEEHEARERDNYGDIYGSVTEMTQPQYGGVIVTFSIRSTGEQEGLGNPFKQGTPLAIEDVTNSHHFQGTVVVVRDGEIDVHMKVPPSLFNSGDRLLCKLDSTDNSGELDVLMWNMSQFKDKESRMKDVLLWTKINRFYPTAPHLNFFDQDLDLSQQNAVRMAIQQRDLALIHGPPGTGKTRTLVEIIRLEVTAGKKKVLFAAASNTAVDNMCERLEMTGLKIVRLGNPARVAEKIQTKTLDFNLRKPYTDLRNVEHLMKAHEKKNTNKAKALEVLVKRHKQRLGQLINSELHRADVVLGTLVNCNDNGPLQHLPKDHFQLTMIDECSQAKEASCWLLVPRSSKMVLVGDYHQLPPIIHKRDIERDLSRSMFERLLKHEMTKKCSSKLKYQYRMNEKIMRWPSTQFYAGKLIAAPSVANLTLSDLDSVRETEETKSVLYLVDTAKITAEKYEKKNNKSYLNEIEAVIVKDHLRKLLGAGLKSEQIGIITPYSSQRELLVAELQEEYPDLEIQSVDGFQGREKEAIIISLVRSNNVDAIGFLGDHKRLNVAITRAKKHLTVICDTETVTVHQQIREFLQYIKKNGTWKRPKPIDVDKSMLKGPRHQGNNFLPIAQLTRSNAVIDHIDRSKVVGIDCEMVLSTERFDILARVAIVTEDGVLMDRFVRTDLEIEDYRTEVSGVRPEDISSAAHIDEILAQVRDILEDALIIVGHDLGHDMEVLGINFPTDKVRDTAFYRPYLKNGGRSSKLRDLAKKFLGKVIQAGEHDPAEDAKAALLLYFHKVSSWEETLRKRKIVQEFHENNFTAQNRFAALMTDDDGSEMNFQDEIFLAETGEPETLSSDEESFHSVQSNQIL